MQTRRRLLLLALVGVWLGGFDAVNAAPARLAILCGDVCGGGAACDDECWLTQFDFDQEYPPTSCGAESYSCCGDGMCDVAVEGCSSALCPDDCGDVSSSCGPGGPCGSGEVENGSNECVIYSPDVPKPGGGSCGGECAGPNDCCGNDYCQGPPGGQGYCAVPSSSYCSSSPPCSGTSGPNSWSSCDQWKAIFCSGGDAVFCDPGIGRCQFVAGTTCPDSSTCSAL